MRYPVFIVFGIAFGIRLAYALLVQYLYPNSIYLYDSWSYLNIAYNLFHDGVYTQMSASPQTPDSTRTPFYPIYIYLFHVLQLHGEWIVYVQAIVGALTASVATHCALLIKRNRFAAFLVGLTVAINIPSIFFANTVLTETWFSFFLVMACYYVIKSIKYEEPNNRILAIVFLVCAIYTRPGALYLLVAIPALIVLYNQHGIKYELIQSIKLLVVTVLLLAPWFYRNKQTFGEPFFSSIAEVNYLFHTASNIKAQVNGTTRHEEEYNYRNAKPLSELNFEHNAHVIPIFRNYAQKEVKSVVQEHPAIAAKIFAKSWVGFFIKPLRSYFNLQLKGKKLGDEKPLSMANGKQSYLSGLISTLTSDDVFVSVLVVLQLLFFILVYGSFLLSLPLWFKQNPRVFIFLICVILYFSITSSITDLDARFRVPVVSLLVLLGYPFWEKRFRKLAHE